MGFVAACLAAAPVVLRAQASVVQTLTSEGRLSEAIRAFDAMADTPSPAPMTALEPLAAAVLERATTDENLLVATDACSTLRRHGRQECAARLNRRASGPTTPPLVRLKMLAAETPVDRAESRSRLAELTETFEQREWSALVEGARDFPPSIRTTLLTQALLRGTPDVQYAALDQLSSMDDPAAVAAARTWSTRTSAPGHLLALAAVARSGDPKALETIRSLLPVLEGEERLAAGVALATQKDPQGLQTIQGVLAGPDELLGLKAAAALASLGQVQGTQLLERELTNTNPWMRLRSLEYLDGRLSAPTAEVWRLMADDLIWIQVRAAQVTLAALSAPTASGTRPNGAPHQ
jgi:HEAT repeat protein